MMLEHGSNALTMGCPKVLDLSVYFIADPSLCRGRPLGDIVEAAVRGGVKLVQYRDKISAKKDMLRNVIALKYILADTPVPLIINDHVDIALEAGAEGVHLGQDDTPPAEARVLLGPDAIIGITAFTAVHMSDIDPAVVNYVGTGPFYPTATNKGKPVLGTDGFKPLADLAPVPVVGIGGITPVNTAEVINAGAKGVAMMRAISEAEDPQHEAAEFVKAVAAARARSAT